MSLFAAKLATGKELIAPRHLSAQRTRQCCVHRHQLRCHSRNHFSKANCSATNVARFHRWPNFAASVVLSKPIVAPYFLDEIGDMTPGTQVKLMRVLQEKKFATPLVAKKTISVDVRVLAATHRDLESAISANQFS